MSQKKIPISQADFRAGQASIMIDGEINTFIWDADLGYWENITTGQWYLPSSFQIF
jgi:hypothetical protein